jgi:hypothetical protein
LLWFSGSTVLFDFTKGKAVQLSVVAEKNSVAAVSFLQRHHDVASAASPQCQAQDFTKTLPSGWQ